MNSYDVVIIGGGITGASALYYLSKNKNIKTILFDKNAQLGQGASGSWGFLSRVFHHKLEVTKLAQQCFDYHYNFKEHFGGDNHYIQTGSLYFLKKDSIPEFSAHLDFFKSSNVDFEMLEAKEGKRRFPEFCWYEDDIAIYEPRAGLTGLGSSVNHLASRGCQGENKVCLGTGVKRITYKNDAVCGVELQDGTFVSSKVVVLCAGAWSTGLMGFEEQLPFFPKVIQLNRFNRYRRDFKLPFFIDLPRNTFGHHLPTGSFIGGYLREQSSSEDVMPGKVNSIEANEAKYEIGKRINWIKNAALEGGLCAVESYSKQGFGHVKWSNKIKNLLYTGGFSCTGYLLFPVSGKKIVNKIVEVL
ncbi:NAD(P)/FAD-dependent oxidoreductase [Candidatus Uabimicrobium sp. HlEnr_7]|uniref:NAD(P)/FAD-dependent oxidoreductase n=1 Tax=Candidatus Uabimicrobium helgolandensis TaxID=3095367 RepID=UPI003558CC01